MIGLFRGVAVLLMLLVASYLLVWILIYSIVMELDYSHLKNYFVLAWSGGGELPATIQLATFLVMGILLLLLLGLWWRRIRMKSRQG